MMEQILPGIAESTVIAHCHRVIAQNHADTMESKYRPPTTIAIERTMRATLSLRLISLSPAKGAG